MSPTTPIPRSGPVPRAARGVRYVTWAAALLLAVHGLIHLMGVALLWRWGEPGGLSYATAHPEPGSFLGIVAGMGWLGAGLLFVAAALLLVAGDARWLVTAGAGAVVSLPVVGLMGSGAPVGLVVDVLVLVAAVFVTVSGGVSRPGARVR